MARPWLDVRAPTKKAPTGRFETPRAPGSDWHEAIQEIVDTLVASAKRITPDNGDSIPAEATLYLPPGIYEISQPVVIRSERLDGVKIEIEEMGMPVEVDALACDTCSIEIVGSGAGVPDDPANTHGSILRPMFKDRPAIIIQSGAAVRIRKLVIEGQNDWISTYDPLAMDTHLAERYIVGGARDHDKSPYAGICVDPFAPVVRGTDRYPGMNDRYEQGGKLITGRGSTYLEVDDCVIKSFVVGIVITAAGDTTMNAALQPANAENIRISNCQIVSTKSAISVNQTQSRAVFVENLSVMGTGVVFDCTGYGQKLGNLPSVFGASILGAGALLSGIPAGSGYSMNGLRAERLLSIGQMQGAGMTGSGNADTLVFNSCHFHFGATPSSSAAANAHFSNIGNTTFNGCTFRIQHEGAEGPVSEPLRLINEGTLTFNGCLFDLPGPGGPPLWVTGVEEGVTYRDCVLRESRPWTGVVSAPWSRYQAVRGFSGPAYIRALTMPGALYTDMDDRREVGPPRWVAGPFPRLSLGPVDLLVTGPGQAQFLCSSDVFWGRIQVGDLVCTTHAIPAVLAPVLDFNADAPVIVGKVLEVSLQEMEKLLVKVVHVPQAIRSGAHDLHITWFPRIHPPTWGVVTPGDRFLREVTWQDTSRLEEGWRPADRIRGERIEEGVHVLSIFEEFNWRTFSFTWTIEMSRPAIVEMEGPPGGKRTRLFDADLHQLAVKRR